MSLRRTLTLTVNGRERELDVAVHHTLLDVLREEATERAGSYDFQVAYLPVTHWQPVPGDTAIVTRAPTRAAACAPRKT